MCLPADLSLTTNIRFLEAIFLIAEIAAGNTVFN